MLPDSDGVYGLIERSDPLVITERMEGGGAYLNPQRLGASGASWTQTTFQLGDADITDPDRTGFAMLYPNLDALEAVSVATAGIHPDTYGSRHDGDAHPAHAVVELAAHLRVQRLAGRRFSPSIRSRTPRRWPASQLRQRLLRRSAAR